MIALLSLLACSPPDDGGLTVGNLVAHHGSVGGTVRAFRRTDGGDARSSEDLCTGGTDVTVETRYADGEWEAAADVALDCEEPPLVDAYLVADNSGSEEDYLEDIVDALQGFAHRMLARNHDDRLGLVRVSTEASVVQDLTSDEDTFDAATEELFITNGWTALWDGMRLANDRLDATTVEADADDGTVTCYSGAYPTVIAFTDGQDNNSADEHETHYAGDGIDTTVDHLQALTAGGVATIVHTVGVGDDIDSDELESLADATGGSYRRIASYGGLDGALHAAAAQISTQVPMCFVPAACDHEEVRIEVVVHDHEDETMTVTASLPNTCPT